MVRHSESTGPARITVQAWGPAGAEDLPERTLPQTDATVSLVRVSRKDGALRITLDLVAAAPPAYSVHQMADWIMIRLLENGGAS